MRKIILKEKDGFTLVEVLMSCAILAIGLLTIGLVIFAQLTFINQSREKAIAFLSAQEEIENIRGMPYDTILSLGPTFVSPGFIYLKNPQGTLTLDNIFGNNNIRRLSVSVSWDSVTGKHLQQDLVTLVTRNGINRQ